MTEDQGDQKPDGLVEALLEVARTLLDEEDGAITLQSAIAGLRKKAPNELSSPRAIQELLSDMDLFEQLFENTPLAIVLMDQADRAVKINAAFRELFGYTLDEVKGKQMTGLIVPPDREAEATRLSRTTLGGRINQQETVRRHKNGTLVPVQLYGLPVTAQGRVVAMYGIYENISERKEAEDQLRHTATHDHLTGLPNRTLFFDRIRVAMERARGRRQSEFAVLFLDLDRFKVINDSLGHAVGDQVLTQVAARLREPLRSGDTVGRLGGDEFGILVNDVEDRNDPLQVASRILEDLQRPIMARGHEVLLSTSIGIAFSNVGHSKPDEVLRDADLAMYAAKTSGAARYRVFQPSMRAQTDARLEMEGDLHRALEEEQLLLVYQPILDLRTGRVEAMEALLRWKHPTRGLFQPADFLPQAEEAGLAPAITEWVLDRVQKDWPRKLGASFSEPAICINLYGRHFSFTRLDELAESVLRQRNRDLPRLWLDVTERAFSNHPDDAQAVADRLRSSGMVLVLDDFGSGYSSLAQLRHLPLDIIKLDRLFVQDVADPGPGQKIVSAMIALARSFGMRACGEGIENGGQLKALGELGCDLGQGRFISPPLAPNRALELLTRGEGYPASYVSLRESTGSPPRSPQ